MKKVGVFVNNSFISQLNIKSMKKYYTLFFTLCIFGGSYVHAQLNTLSIPAVPAMPIVPKVAADISGTNVLFTGSPTKTLVRRGALNYSAQIRIGSTYYDLQTNYCMPHRLILNPDGSVSAVYTTSPNATTNFPQRGTGYNFRNAAGTWGAPDSNRCEGTQRTGWPSIGRLSNGNEFVVGHDATVGGFFMSKSASPGSKPGNPVFLSGLSEATLGYKPIWARMANSGDTIHMVYSYTDSAVAGEKRAPTRKGIFAPMVYSRSLDAGTTWDIQHIMLPGYDSTLTNNGGGDQYAIDVRGKTVAIVNVDLLQGVIAWKSTDFGTTFQRIIVDTFKYAPYNDKKLMLDTPFTNDGTADVILDKNNNMHVFWGLARVIDTDTNTAGYSFYPGLQGLQYWNEATDSTKLIASGAAFDRSGDNINAMEQATYSSLVATGIPGGVGTVARLGTTSCMRQPNASIDNNGNIYCIFSVPIEQDISDLGANYRDLGIVYSTNGGGSWATSQNITQSILREDDFGTVARKANGFLHVAWQSDEIPGTNLQNNFASAGNHDVVLNVIKYSAIPVSEILNNSIGMLWGLGIDKPNTGEVMVVNQNYPNPFHGKTNVLVYLTRPGDVAVSVHNMAGTEVYHQMSAGLMRGNHVLEIDGAGLSAGIYTYTLTAGGSTVSKTMIIK